MAASGVCRRVTPLSLACRFLLAFTFLAASVPKLIAPDDFHRAVVGYGVVPPRLAAHVAVWLPRLELGVGLALFVGIALPIAALVTAAMLISMTAVVAFNLARGRTIDCGCFGRSAPRRISWNLVVQNLFLMLAAGLIAVHPAGFQFIDLGLAASRASPSDTIALGLAASAAVVAAGLVGPMGRGRRALGAAIVTTSELSP